MIQQEQLNNGNILIVDDESTNVRLLERMLRNAGYKNVLGTTDPREVSMLVGQFEPDLIVLDLHMPQLDGFSVMTQLQADLPEEELLPILVLTADDAVEIKRRALLVGARDFLVKPVDQFELLLRIRNLVEMRLLSLESRKAAAE